MAGEDGVAGVVSVSLMALTIPGRRVGTMTPLRTRSALGADRLTRKPFPGHPARPVPEPMPGHAVGPACPHVDAVGAPRGSGRCRRRIELAAQRLPRVPGGAVPIP